MKSYPRQEKIAELIHFQLAQLIRRECRGRYLNENVSISDIRASRGGFDCKVYLSSFKGRDYAERAIAEANGRAGQMRSYLGKRLRMKKIPLITFHADEVLEQGMRIDRLLRDERRQRGLDGRGPEAAAPADRLGHEDG